jgi:Icc-related predicted phosphoesterase
MLGQGNTGLDALLNRPKPSSWQSFLASPLKYLARSLYKLQQQEHNIKQTSDAINVVCISDTHNTQPEVPYGDLLVHAGDLTQSGSLEEVQRALTWLRSLSHPHKVIIAGNHDMTFDNEDKAKLDLSGITYLEDSSTSITFPSGRILNIYGNPWTPTPGTWAFQHPRAKDVWTGSVPQDTDILITHRPPRFHLDIAGYGDDNLLKELWRTRPRLHVFGHVHGGYGQDFLVYDRFESWYEDICRSSGGVASLLKMFYRFCGVWWSSRAKSGTVLVNALPSAV